MKNTMKNTGQFLLALLAALVFGLGWPSLWAEMILTVFAILAIFGDSKKIEVVEITLPFVVIILFHQKPELWWVCLGLTAFLAVWNITDPITALRQKLS